MRMLLLVILILAAALVRAPAQVPDELRGRVTTVTTGGEIPVRDARVEIVGRPESARTAADGAFVIRGLEPRSYVARVRAVGYRMFESDVEIENGRAAVLDIVLEPAVTTLDVVTVRGERDSSAAGATTFDRAAIEASGRRDLGELLQSTPGVLVTQAGGPGSASHASIRGSSANEVLVLADGVPLNSPITGEADLSRVQLENVERVIVYTGSQSARFGPRALGGVIEIETRRAAREASMSMRGGAWGEGSVSSLVAGTRPTGAGTFGASLAGDYHTLRGDFAYDVPAVRGGGTVRRVNDASTSREILGVATWEDGAWSAAGRASVDDLHRGLAGSIVQPSLTGREGQGRSDVGVDAAYRRGLVSWSTTTSMTRERATYRDPAPPFGTPYDDSVRATSLDAVTRFVVGSDALSGSIGGEARTIDVQSTMLAPGSPRWQGLLGAFVGLHGVREVTPSGTRAAADLNARIDRSSLSGSAVSPEARLMLSREHLAVSASIGEGYSPPSLADQFFQEGVQVRPNPSLRPERTRDDVELRIAANALDAGFARVDMEAAVYRANVDGMILWSPDFRFIWSPANFAVRRSGSELSGRVTLAALPVDLHGTLNSSHVAYAGPVMRGQVVYRPRTTGDISFGGGPAALHVEIANRYVGERRTVPGDPINSLPSYWRTDAMLSTSRVWRSVAVVGTLAMDNVFNRPAAMLVDYPFPGRAWSVTLRVRRREGPSAG
jgi:vitamin B12 transporter